MKNLLITKILFLLLFLAGSSFHGISSDLETVGERFASDILENPRMYSEELLMLFSSLETDSFAIPQNGSEAIVLANGYASPVISNRESYNFDKNLFKVKHIDIVFTKYPLHKKDWLTNYYDLLAWRLNELFAIDSTLNNADIEWGLVLQIQGKTAAAAKELFHGIVITLEPLETLTDELPPADSNRESTRPSGIENGGFIMKEDRDPRYFRSPQAAEPIPGKVLRRNMDPKKLKCPTWR
jgi:hypothetical protein